jgi:GNAT superfamily N-acetyltransferase
MALSRVESNQKFEVNIIKSVPKCPEDVLGFMHPTYLAIQEGINNEDWKGDEGHFTIPFGEINGASYDLWLRRRKYYPRIGSEIAIDLGWKRDCVFTSLATVEASVETTIDAISDRSPLKPKIGLIKKANPIIWMDEIKCERNRAFLESELGLFVDETLRGNGIGKALISAVRVVLNEEGIQTLLLDDLTDINPRNQTGAFYQKLGGRIFYVKSGAKSERKVPKLLLPTQSTFNNPYVFC